MSGFKRPRDADDDDEYRHDPVAESSTKRMKPTNALSRSRQTLCDVDEANSSNVSTTLKMTLKKTPAPGKGVYWNRGLNTLEKVEKRFEELGILRRSVRPVGADMKSNIASLFETPAPKDKQYTVLRKVKGTPNVPKFSNRGKLQGAEHISYSVQIDGPNKSKFQVYFHGHDHNGNVDITDENVQIQLADSLEDFYNAFTKDYAIPTSTGIHTRVAEVALMRINEKALSILAPAWVATKGLQVSIPYIDENTGELERYEFDSASAMELSPGMPGLPSHAQLYTSGQKGKKYFIEQSSPGVFDTVIPDDILDGTSKTKKPKDYAAQDPQKLRNTEDFMRFCSWKLSGLISTNAKMKQARLHLQQCYVIKVDGATGRGNTAKTAYMSLFKIRPSERFGTTLKVGSKLLSSLTNSTNSSEQINITINSLDGSWVAPVLEHGKQTYVDTGDAFDTTINTARFVTKVNSQIANGHAPTLSDFCTDEMQRLVTHKCHGCYNDILCFKLKRNGRGLPFCETCLNTDMNVDQETISIRRAKATVTNEVKREANRLEQDPLDSDNQKIKNLSIKFVTKSLQGSKATTYKDGMSEEEFDSYAGFSPFNQTIDAALPAAVDHRGQNRGHVEGNLVPTACCTNMAKAQRSRNIPADVASISDFCRKVDANKDDRAEVDQARAEVIKACDDHNIVIAKYKLNPQSKEGVIPDPKAFEAIKAELIAGKVSDLDEDANEAATKQARRMFSKGTLTPCAWDNAEKGLARKYASEAKVTDFAADGAPWPFPDVAMPQEFEDNGWDTLFTFVQLRLARMDISCNRHWITVDSELSLLAEILRQLWLHRYDQFLGLPVSPFVCNALMVSVAHKHHGNQMRTGYDMRPESLHAWDEELCNILIETTFSNFLKMDWPESFYESIKQYVPKIRVPLELYNPTAKPEPSTLSKDDILEGEVDCTTGVMHRELDANVMEQFNKAAEDTAEDMDDED